MNEPSPRGRWRCKACGSTRITAICHGYTIGRLDNESDVLRVTEGESVVHLDGYEVDRSSVQCENCGHNSARYETSGRGPHTLDALGPEAMG